MYRAIVDVVAHKNISSNVILNKAERKELTHTLHNACIVNGVKTNVLSDIDMTCESLKRIILDKSNEELCLPTVLPVEQFAPKTGTVRLLRLTEKQHQNIYMVSGETDYQEKTVGSNCHIML